MTEYEWTIEERTIYEDGTFDIENHDFADRLEQYPPNQWAEIGSKGCGCTPESAGSGNVWVRCELKNGPVLESIGTRCVRKTLPDKE